MARILSLDTTSEFASIALVEGDAVVEELMLHSTDGFSHVLYPHLQALLARHGWELPTIDCFASATGPGSFTGVRVGLAAVKGLAEGAGKPVVGVSNLRAIARFGSAKLRASVIDARRGEIYGAVYDSDLRIVFDEIVNQFPAWLVTLPEEIEFVSTDFGPFRAALAGTRFEQAPVTEAPRALAGAIGLIASGVYDAGEAVDPAAVDANYVRRTDAELKWKEPG